jgi:hypothetical protein
MIKILIIATLLTACGTHETVDVVEYRPVSKEVRASLVFETIAEIATAKVYSLGFRTEHMTYAKHLIDDEAIRDLSNERQLNVLAFAYCADYRIACRAVYSHEIEVSEEMRVAVGLHEALHLLGFGHEECPLDGCRGIMGTYYEHFDDPEATLTEEYLRKLPYKEPIQPEKAAS